MANSASGRKERADERFDVDVTDHDLDDRPGNSPWMALNEPRWKRGGSSGNGGAAIPLE